MSILALADDMTGALEVGAKFSAVGFHTVVAAKPLESTAAQVIVYDTKRVTSCRVVPQRWCGASFCNRAPFALTSYIRKPIRRCEGYFAELKAISELFPDWRIGYAPAYPALGRTVKQGILYVDGVEVSQTSFGSDPLNPVTTSAISLVLGGRLDCTIFDGEHDSHIEDAARTILTDRSMRIIAGPGALAGIIAGQLAPTRSAPVALPRISSCLVMNGSLHHRSITQMRHAEAPGWTRGDIKSRMPSRRR